MKIAIVTSTFPPYHGGMGNVAYFHARELARRGEEVTVFCPKQKSGALENENFKINYLVPIFRCGNAAWTPQLAWKLREFDLVHLHYPFFGGAEAVFFWKKSPPKADAPKAQNKAAGPPAVRREKRKLFLTYHMDTVGQGFVGWIFRIYRHLFLPRIIKMADRVFVSTMDYAHAGDLAKFVFQDPEKFIVSNLGVDVKRFSPGAKPENLKNKFAFSEKDFILLFVGGLDKAHYFKGLGNALLAIKKLNNPDIKLVVVGEGELKPQFEAQAKELGIENQIFFAGGVPNEELADYYRLCDVHIFPSVDKSEAYGLVALEAGACAKPVVASSLPGVRHVVLDHKSGFLIEPKDVDALAQKIDYLFKNPDVGERLGRFARQRIENEFTWGAIVENLKQYY